MAQRFQKNDQNEQLVGSVSIFVEVCLDVDITRVLVAARSIALHPVASIISFDNSCGCVQICFVRFTFPDVLVAPYLRRYIYRLGIRSWHLIEVFTALHAMGYA